MKSKAKESSSSSSSDSDSESSSSSSSISKGRYKRKIEKKSRDRKREKEKESHRDRDKDKDKDKEKMEPEIEVVPLNTYLYVKGLTRTVNQNHLQEIFSIYGDIKKLTYNKDSNGKHLYSSKSHAYIEYEKNENIELAHKCINGGQIDGWVIVAEILNITEKELEERIKNFNRERSKGEMYSRFGNKNYQGNYYSKRNNRGYASSPRKFNDDRRMSFKTDRGEKTRNRSRSRSRSPRRR